MKKILLSIVAAALTSFSASAYDFEEDGVFYNITSAMYQTCEVTCQSGAFNSYSGIVSLPSTVKYDGQTYTVTSIGSDAFRASTDLLCTLLPSTIRSIGANAYQGCTSMAAVTFPASVMNIGEMAFDGCSALSSVTNYATTPQDIAANTFSTFSTLHVPTGLKDVYAAAPVWNQFDIVEDATVGTPVTQITLDQQQVHLWIGQTAQLQATVSPADATVSKVAWSSSNDAVVTVDDNGQLTGVSEGAATVTAKATDGSGISASATITVEEHIAWDITLNLDYATISIGETLALTATLSPSDLPNTTVEWASSDENVATVSADGIVTGVMFGQATISASTTDGSMLQASCTVTVSPTMVKSITLSQQSATMAINGTLQLTATVAPEDAAIKDVEWATSDASIATVTQDGLVTALAAGKATITAEAIDGSGVKGRCEVTVQPNNYDFIANGVYLKVVSEENKYCVVVYRDADYNSYSGEVVIPDSVEYKNSIYTVTGIGKYAFYLCDQLTAVTIPSTVISIGHHAFTGCVSLGSLVLPNSVKTIGESAFASCNAMTSLTLSTSMTEIAEETFFACNSLTSLNIPANIVTVGPRAFCRCSALTEVTLNEGLVTLGDGAFKGCSALPSIDLPSTVANIGKSTFADCPALNDVYNQASRPQTIYETTFSQYGTLHVLMTRKNAFATAEYWKNFEIVEDILGILIESITLNKEEYECAVGESVQPVATINPNNASVKVLEWSSSDEDVLKVSATTGKFTGMKNGIAYLTATAADGSGVSATAKVTVGVGYTTIETITLSATAADVQLGATLTLTASILPENASIQTLTWTSSDESIATVTSEGVVSALALGKTTITAAATDGSNVTAQCVITVVPVVATALELSSQSIDLMVGQSHTLTANFTPANTTNMAVTWASANTTIATVSAEGEVTALALGTVEVTATTTDGSNLSATCTVNVVPTPVGEITLNAETLDLYPGDTFTLEAFVSPEDATEKDVTWSSTDDEIVMVSSTGKVVAIKTGTATVIATATDGSGVTGNCVITVLQPLVSSINFVADTLKMNIGESMTLEPLVLPADAGNKELEWASDNEDVAMVSSRGKVVAVEVGTALITATAVDGSGVTGSVTIEVVDPAGIHDVTMHGLQIIPAHDAIIVRGLANGTNVTLYNLAGIMIGHAKVADGSAVLNAQPGSTVIVKAEGKSVKAKL